MTFSDPSHPLLDVSAALERATDEYVAAIDGEAEAENAYLRAHAIAYAKAAVEGVAATMRDKFANAQPEVVEARCAFNMAAARAKACRAKCQQLESRVNASQSYFRLVGAQS